MAYISIRIPVRREIDQQVLMLLFWNFVLIIAIWSTTPLAIAWSAIGVGFVPAITFRMIPAALLSWMLCKLLKIEISWHRQAILSYSAAAMGMSGSLTMAYWASQYVESGMLSVIFGMTPIVSGLLSVWILKETFFSAGKLSALLVALLGFVLIFHGEMQVSGRGIWGLAVLFAAVWVFSLSAVLIKKIDLQDHPLAMSCGSLIIASPLFLLLWLATGLALPDEVPTRAILSIAYLILFGSILGFVAFFYVLRRMRPRDVGLINLLAPIFALYLGAKVNAERLEPIQWVGAAMVLISLAFYQWGGWLWRFISPTAQSVNDLHPKPDICFNPADHSLDPNPNQDK